ncbi:hypothetical protein B296_00013036 [Ensete ventricosum]|uniref:Uncharacterized protein n=1 Tax=Ensete ventricosum TaxID=4639 RepID=A0A427ABC2_ENSVE|nr:hypothetical protein B296_00013036 [Ensete ventricosum]
MLWALGIRLSWGRGPFQWSKEIRLSSGKLVAWELLVALAMGYEGRCREKGLSSSPGSLLAGGISSPRRSPRSYYHEAQGIRSDVVPGTLGGKYGVGWSVTSQDLRWRHTVDTVPGSRVAGAIPRSRAMGMASGRRCHLEISGGA